MRIHPPSIPTKFHPDPSTNNGGVAIFTSVHKKKKKKKKSEWPFGPALRADKTPRTVFSSIFENFGWNFLYSSFDRISTKHASPIFDFWSTIVVLFSGPCLSVDPLKWSLKSVRADSVRLLPTFLRNTGRLRWNLAGIILTGFPRGVFLIFPISPSVA